MIVSVGPIENVYPNFAECCHAVCSFHKFGPSVAICACCPQYFAIKEIHIHPQFDYFDEDSRYNNLALIELTHAIKFTKFVRPAILPQSWFFPITKLTSIETCRASNQEEFASPFRHATLANSRDCVETWRRINRKKIPNGLMRELQFCGSATPDEMICRVSV